VCCDRCLPLHGDCLSMDCTEQGHESVGNTAPSLSTFTFEDGYDAGHHQTHYDFGDEFGAQALSGDFYHQPANVTRGLTLRDEPELLSSFCNEPDDVTRGLTLPEEFDLLNSFCPSLALGKLGDDWMTFPISSNGLQAEDEDGPRTGGSSVDTSKDFEDTDVPPELKEEARLPLGANTLHLNMHSPVAAGNQLCSFFKQKDKVVAEIKKVNRKKFTVSATGIMEDLPFQVKVRIYQENSGSCLEFQRRSGDALACMWLFRRASEYFGCSSLPSKRLHAPALTQTTPVRPDHAVAPLLDMVNYSEDVNELSHVASTLAAMAEDDPMVAAELRMPCAFSAIQRLQQFSDFRVSHPMSRLLAVA